jgi:hypothetical protein
MLFGQLHDGTLRNQPYQGGRHQHVAVPILAPAFDPLDVEMVAQMQLELSNS